MRISIAEFEETYLPVMEEEFKQDTMDSVMEHPVFNRIVSLKSSFKLK